MRTAVLATFFAIAATTAPVSGSAQTSSGDPLLRQKAALEVIRDFADSFCKTIPQKGTSGSVELSGDAKANLGGLLKKITDLGFEGAAKYKEDDWQGPLRESLAEMTKNNQTCRLEIWKDLSSKLLDPQIVQTIDNPAKSSLVVLGPGTPGQPTSGTLYYEFPKRYIIKDHLQ